jgi:hypothetical protein
MRSCISRFDCTRKTLRGHIFASKTFAVAVFLLGLSIVFFAYLIIRLNVGTFAAIIAILFLLGSFRGRLFSGTDGISPNANETIFSLLSPHC